MKHLVRIKNWTAQWYKSFYFPVCDISLLRSLSITFTLRSEAQPALRFISQICLFLEIGPSFPLDAYNLKVRPLKYVSIQHVLIILMPLIHLRANAICVLSDDIRKFLMPRWFALLKDPMCPELPFALCCYYDVISDPALASPNQYKYWKWNH